MAGVKVNPPAESSVVEATLTKFPLLKLRNTTSVPASKPAMVPPMEPGAVFEAVEPQPIQPAESAAKSTAEIKEMRFMSLRGFGLRR